MLAFAIHFVRHVSSYNSVKLNLLLLVVLGLHALEFSFHLGNNLWIE